MAQELILTDGTDTFRLQVRDGILATDQTLTPEGFAGDESIDEGVTGDWVCWEKFPHEE